MSASTRFALVASLSSSLFLRRYLQSPDLARRVDGLASIAYPVELGIRLRQLIYPVHKMFAEEFGIDPDARALLEEFTVRCEYNFFARIFVYHLMSSLNERFERSTPQTSSATVTHTFLS